MTTEGEDELYEYIDRYLEDEGVLGGEVPSGRYQSAIEDAIEAYNEAFGESVDIDEGIQQYKSYKSDEGFTSR